MNKTKLNFNGVAIFCETWQQMLHLAELAMEHGLSPYWFGQGDHTFENGYCYFMLCSPWIIPPDHFSNYKEWDVEGETIIPYHTFINQTPAQDSVYGC